MKTGGPNDHPNPEIVSSSLKINPLVFLLSLDGWLVLCYAGDMATSADSFHQKMDEEKGRQILRDLLASRPEAEDVVWSDRNWGPFPKSKTAQERKRNAIRQNMRKRRKQNGL